jgi:autotransporter-associated beta strand protein
VTTLNITSSTGVNCTNNFNGATVKPTTANTWVSGLARANVRDGGAILDTASINVTVSQPLVHSDITGDSATDGGLTKKGAGILTLTGTSTYTGPTTVSNGTLRVNGSIAGSGVTVVSGATLDGIGTVGATVDVQTGGTLSPGNSIGTLALGAAPALGGTVLMEINRTNAQTADKLNITSGTASFGSVLTLNNTGPALLNGDTFDLFDGTLSGSFATLNLPNGAAHWNTSDLNVGGTIAYINNSPVANNFDVGVAVGGTTTATVIGKFAAATDADGDTVTITGVSTPASGTAIIVGGTNITYTSTATAGSDSFTYTVSDGLGGTDTKTVSVTVSSPEGFNKLSGPINNGNGTLTIDYLGLPNANYALDTTASLTPPITWTPVVTNTAAGNGALSFTFPTGDSQGFFRTRHVP